MTIWQLRATKLFDKQLKRVDQAAKVRILAFLKHRVLSADDPRLYGKPLTGELSGYWSYRIGDYRVIADIEDETFTIIAIDVGHRRDIYTLH